MDPKNIRKVSYRSTDSAGQPIPSLILQGKFLEGLGFYRGGHVLVFYARGKIEISIADQSLISILKGGDNNDGIQILLPGPNLVSHQAGRRGPVA